VERDMEKGRFSGSLSLSEKRQKKGWERMQQEQGMPGNTGLTSKNKGLL